MFKKLEVWLVLLILIIFITITFCGMYSLGVLTVYNIKGGRKFKTVSNFGKQIFEYPVIIYEQIIHNPMQVKQPIGYGTGFEKFKDIDQVNYLLLSRYSDQDKQSIIELVNIKTFEILYQWVPDTDEFLKHISKRKNGEKIFPSDPSAKSKNKKENVHPLMNSDGSLIFVTPVLTKVDKDGQLIWQNETLYTHHTIEEDHEKNLWVCASKFNPEKSNHYLDGIAKFSPNGELMFYKSINEIFENNNMKGIISGIGQASIDHFGNIDTTHINDIVPVLNNGPYWKKGDLFLSLRNLSMVLLYRPSTDKIIWKKIGIAISQHDIDILDDHTISIFSNNTPNVKPKHGYNGVYNDVLVYNFKTDSVSSPYKKAFENNKIFTSFRGESHIFDDRNILIEESANGRFFMIDRNGEVIWQYVNQGNDGNRYKVSIFRIIKDESKLDFLKTI